jgi:hypothetical protein
MSLLRVLDTSKDSIVVDARELIKASTIMANPLLFCLQV